ncbi:MAG: hypothetical protein NT154_09775 [Verrucomicrobia bacterium]|nr:hypothetical protein [Verrucomicrobiota bacterium]
MNIEQIEELKAEGKRRTAVSLAACSLACRRRGYRERQSQRKVFTGYLKGRRRAYRGQPVVLPDDTLGFIYGILRGKAAVWKESPFMIGEREHLVVDVSDIRRYRLPSAALLGRQKAGVVERPSARKRVSCRRNGCRPCAPGKRRGRPPNSRLQPPQRPAPTA